ALGAALTLIGSTMTWASGQGLDGRPATYIPIVASSGMLIVAATLILFGLSLSRSAAESRTRSVQASFAVAAIVCLLGWLQAWRDFGSFLELGPVPGWSRAG